MQCHAEAYIKIQERANKYDNNAILRNQPERSKRYRQEREIGESSNQYLCFVVQIGLTYRKQSKMSTVKNNMMDTNAKDAQGGKKEEVGMLGYARKGNKRSTGIYGNSIRKMEQKRGRLARR